MAELLNSHHLYCMSENCKIRLSVQKAEEEWNICHAPSQLAKSQKGIHMVDDSTSVDAPVRRTRSSKQKQQSETTVVADGSPNNHDSDNVDKVPLDMQHTTEKVNAIEGTTDATQKADGPDVEENKAANARAVTIDASITADNDIVHKPLLHPVLELAKDVVDSTEVPMASSINADMPKAVEGQMANAVKDSDMHIARDKENATEGTSNSNNEVDGPVVEQDKTIKVDEVPVDASKNYDNDNVHKPQLHTETQTARDGQHGSQVSIASMNTADMPEVEQDKAAIVVDGLGDSNNKADLPQPEIVKEAGVVDDSNEVGQNGDNNDDRDILFENNTEEEKVNVFGQYGGNNDDGADLFEQNNEDEKVKVAGVVEDSNEVGQNGGNNDGKADLFQHNNEDKKLPTGANAQHAPPPPPAPPWATPEMMALFMSHMTTITQNLYPATAPQSQVPQPKAEKDTKQQRSVQKKRGRKKQKTSSNAIAHEDEDDDSDVGDRDEMTTSENTYRRLNWQKGRQDWSRPSKLKAEIEKVTVDTLPEIYPKMRKHGWAILRDMTHAFAPKSRFTREQMEHINQCTSHVM
jgi:hypothetical protein